MDKQTAIIYSKEYVPNPEKIDVRIKTKKRPKS